MPYTLPILALLIAGSTSTFAQSLVERSTREPIRIDVLRQQDNRPARPVATFYYNQLGDIRFIASGTLHPVAEPTADQYWAEYQYGTDDQLETELLYAENTGDSQLLRTTRYTYREDTLFVTVRSNTGELLANMREWPTDTGIVRKFGLDHVLIGGPEHARNLTVYARYRNEELVAHTVLHDSVDYRSEIRTHWEGDTKIFTYRERGKHRNYSGTMYQFHDRRGRLQAMGSKPKKRAAFTRITYGKNGLLTRIQTIAVKPGTGERARFRLNFDTQLDPATKPTDAILRKINREVLELYEPVTGRMRYLNFFDSRRFMSHQG